MKPGEREPVLDGILVLLDASPASVSALEAGAAVASRTGARLLGLFVEDRDLVRASQLSVSGHLSLPAGVPLRLDPELVERRLAAARREAERAFEEVVRGRGLSGSFRAERGPIAATVAAAAAEVDLVVLGWSPAARGRGIRLAAAARAAVEYAPRLLVIPSGCRLGEGVLAAFGDEPEDAVVLAEAGRLAVALAEELALLLTAASQAAAAELQARAGAWLMAHEVRASFERLALPPDLSALQQRSRGRLLVLDAGRFVGGAGRELLDELRGPLLLVRGPGRRAGRVLEPASRS
jgi:hypothetical protein